MPRRGLGAAPTAALAERADREGAGGGLNAGLLRTSGLQLKPGKEHEWSSYDPHHYGGQGRHGGRAGEVLPGAEDEVLLGAEVAEQETPASRAICAMVVASNP